MLQDMRTMATRATAGMGESAASKTVGQSSEFAALLKQSLDKVNQAQQQATTLQQAALADDPNVSLQDVMVSLQKANMSFQTMLQVRNKLTTAYQEVMNLTSLNSIIRPMLVPVNGQRARLHSSSSVGAVVLSDL